MKSLFKLSASVALIVCVGCGGSSPTNTPPPSTTGSLAVTISGLPGAANAGVTVTGPGNFNQVVTATQTLTGLAPGNYIVTASNVTVSQLDSGVTDLGFAMDIAGNVTLKPGMAGRLEVVPGDAGAPATVRVLSH